MAHMEDTIPIMALGVYYQPIWVLGPAGPSDPRGLLIDEVDPIRLHTLRIASDNLLAGLSLYSRGQQIGTWPSSNFNQQK